MTSTTTPNPTRLLCCCSSYYYCYYYHYSLRLPRRRLLLIILDSLSCFYWLDIVWLVSFFSSPVSFLVPNQGSREEMEILQADRSLYLLTMVIKRCRVSCELPSPILWQVWDGHTVLSLWIVIVKGFPLWQLTVRTQCRIRGGKGRSEFEVQERNFRLASELTANTKFVCEASWVGCNRPANT